MYIIALLNLKITADVVASELLFYFFILSEYYLV